MKLIANFQNLSLLRGLTLEMRSAASVSQQLRRIQKRSPATKLPLAMQRFLTEAWKSQAAKG